MLNTQPDEAFAERGFVVTLRFARETLHFAVNNLEAKTPEQAEQVARGRIDCDNAYLDDLFLGRLIEAPIVRVDTEDNRKAAGITCDEYPEMTSELSWDWYDTAGRLTNTTNCETCGTPLSRPERARGNTCTKHVKRGAYETRVSSADEAAFYVEALAIIQYLQDAGYSERGVAKELNARGLPTQNGAPWTRGLVFKVSKLTLPVAA